MKKRRIFTKFVMIFVILQLLCCSQNAVAEKSTTNTIKIAVWGFHYLDLKSRSMSNKYLPDDFQKVAEGIPQIEIINSIEIKNVLKRTKLEKLDPAIVLNLAEKVNADISIWGEVSQIDRTLFNVNFFILDTQTEDIKFERKQVEKKTEKRAEAVTSILNKALELKKFAEEKAKDIALNFFTAEQYADAKSAFLNLLKINPNEKTAYTYLAYISAVEEDYETAISYYQDALEIDPEYLEALEGLAWSYKINEDYEMALENYILLTEIVPEKIDYWNEVGEIYKIQENIECAIDAYQSAIKQDSTCMEACKNIGLLYFENDSFDEAIHYLKTFLNSEINEKDVEKKLAIAYQKTGRLEECIQQNLEIIKKDSTKASSFLNLAAAYTTQENFEKALNALRKFINLAPNSAIGYNRISDVYRQMKNYEKAVSNAKKSAEIAPDEPEAYLLLGEIDNECGYIHYRKFVDYDEKAKNPDLSSEYGENNKLRGFHKKKSQSYFVAAKEYYSKANLMMTDFFMKEKLKEKISTVNLLIEETKFDKFYDE
ncbi:MAG: tetratricopeptide repeat protein [Candidatus Cloacimonetes bacterium]|nr:tetratricopeptide repeat protein [Candidatus Cloacimonadota bacterium]